MAMKRDRREDTRIEKYLLPAINVLLVSAVLWVAKSTVVQSGTLSRMDEQIKTLQGKVKSRFTKQDGREVQLELRNLESRVGDLRVKVAHCEAKNQPGDETGQRVAAIEKRVSHFIDEFYDLRCATLPSTQSAACHCAANLGPR